MEGLFLLFRFGNLTKRKQVVVVFAVIKQLGVNWG